MQRVALSSTTGESVDVTAAVRVTPVGREVELDIERLRDPRPDGLYELWFVSADGTAPRLGGHVPSGRAGPRDRPAAGRRRSRGLPAPVRHARAQRRRPAPHRARSPALDLRGLRGLPVGALERVLRHLQRRARLPDHLRDDLRDALGAVEDRQVVDVLEGLRRGADDLRQLLGELLADDRVGLLLQRLGTLGDRLGLGQPARPDRRALGLALGLRGLALGDAALAGDASLTRADLLDLLGLGRRRELDLAGLGLAIEMRASRSASACTCFS